VPDEIVVRLLEKKIAGKPKTKGFLFKGFPRTIVQAYILDGLLRKLESTVTSAINLNVPTLESIKRLTARSKTQSKRAYDADTDIIIHRLEQHEKRSIKVGEYYSKQSKLDLVNGVGDEDTVANRLSESVIESFKKIR